MMPTEYSTILDQRREGLRRDLDRILTGKATFLLEIGCGHGHFLTAFAASHPERTCVGIDLIGERIERAERKRVRANLGNLHFIQAEARLFLEAIPPTTRIDTVFVLFPDPWPKARHNKHRIIQPAFLASLAGHVVADCPLYFRTDFTPYFTDAGAAIAADRQWQVQDEPWPFEFATVFQQRAEAFHSLVARCQAAPGGANPVPAVRNAP